MTTTSETPTKTSTRLDRILATVADYFNVTRDQLVSPSRQQHIVLPRQVCMYLARKRTTCSLEEIGDVLGGRDHTTVMHGVRTIDRAVRCNDLVEKQVRQVEERLEAR